jgi:hypothetical protein
MDNLMSAFLYVIVAGGIDYGLSPYIFEHTSSPTFARFLVGVLLAVEAVGFLWVLFKSSE